MIDYNQNSRYYSCYTENDLPQSNFTTDRYSYDTVTVLASEDGRLDLLSYRVYGSLQQPVHSPLFPLLSPSILLIRHNPE